MCHLESAAGHSLCTRRQRRAVPTVVPPCQQWHAPATLSAGKQQPLVPNGQEAGWAPKRTKPPVRPSSRPQPRDHTETRDFTLITFCSPPCCAVDRFKFVLSRELNELFKQLPPVSVTVEFYHRVLLILLHARDKTTQTAHWITTLRNTVERTFGLYQLTVQLGYVNTYEAIIRRPT
jgi:hypothetical protein